MYPKLSRVLFIALLTLLVQTEFAAAQAIPKSIQQGGTEGAIKERKNAWTVGIAGGLIDGTYMRFADELAKVLDDGDNLRILPMVSYGAAFNVDVLLYLRGVDIAVTQSDVFEYFRTERKTPNLQNRVHYIVRLPIAELHVLAKTDIRSLEDLRGKKVNFGPAGSGSSLTGTIVFQRLGVQVEQVLIDQQSALQKLQSGDIAALVRVIGKPVDFFTRIPPNSGLDPVHYRPADARALPRPFGISRRHQSRFSGLPESLRNQCATKSGRSRGLVPRIPAMARATGWANTMTSRYGLMTAFSATTTISSCAQAFSGAEPQLRPSRCV